MINEFKDFQGEVAIDDDKFHYLSRFLLSNRIWLRSHIISEFLLNQLVYHRALLFENLRLTKQSIFISVKNYFNLISECQISFIT